MERDLNHPETNGRGNIFVAMDGSRGHGGCREPMDDESSLTTLENNSLYSGTLWRPHDYRFVCCLWNRVMHHEIMHHTYDSVHIPAKHILASSIDRNLLSFLTLRVIYTSIIYRALSRLYALH